MAIDGLEALVPWSNVEHWLPDMLEAEMPDGIAATSRMEDGQPLPFLLVKETPLVGPPHVEYGLARKADVEVHCFAEGVDAEDDARDLAVACEIALKKFEGRLVTPAEKLARVFVTESAVRRIDWEDPTGPVQYQDLPTQVERFKVGARLVIARRNGKGILDGS